MIYKEIELSIDESKLSEFIEEERQKIEYSVHSFDEPYNGITIKNPTTNTNAVYYVLAYGGTTFLQQHSPFVGGFAPVLDESAEDVIEKHIENLIDTVVFSKFAVVSDKAAE